MNSVPISYLLDMSDIEATNWLIENCHDYVLVKRAAIKQLRAENEELRNNLKNSEEQYQKAYDEVALLMDRAEQAERGRERRDIEQQIKALEWVITNECMGWYEVNRIQRRIRQLRAQLEGK